jgi:hypothetical protein
MKPGLFVQDIMPLDPCFHSRPPEKMVNEKIRIENLRVDLITNCQEHFILEIKPSQPRNLQEFG